MNPGEAGEPGVPFPTGPTNVYIRISPGLLAWSAVLHGLRYPALVVPWWFWAFIRFLIRCKGSCNVYTAVGQLRAFVARGRKSERKANCMHGGASWCDGGSGQDFWRDEVVVLGSGTRPWRSARLTFGLRFGAATLKAPKDILVRYRTHVMQLWRDLS